MTDANVPKCANVGSVKTDVERGAFGSWAFRARDLLDLKVEDVADRLGFHPASLRKVEAGGAPASRRLRRDLPDLYRTLAEDKHVSLPPLPQEDVPDAPADDLAAAIRAQTEAMRELVVELREARQAQQGRDEGLAAVIARLGERLELSQLAPVGKSQTNNG